MKTTESSRRPLARVEFCGLKMKRAYYLRYSKADMTVNITMRFYKYQSKFFSNTFRCDLSATARVFSYGEETKSSL